MINLLKKLFGAKPAEQTAEAPYKVEAAPVIELVPSPTPVVVAEAVVPAAVVEQAPAKNPAPKKQQFAKKPAAPKTVKPKTPSKPKAKPAA